MHMEWTCYISVLGYGARRNLSFNMDKVNELIGEALQNVTEKEWTECVQHVNSSPNARSAHGELLWSVVVRQPSSYVVRQHLMFTL